MSALDANFIVRAVPDGQVFAVSREALRTSDVFRDMFFCCDESEGIVDLLENTETLATLLNLLHYPPKPPEQHLRDDTRFIPKLCYEPKTVIPLPLLPLLFSLVDKYALPESTAQVLNLHLLAHAPDEPLWVYAFAVEHELATVASEASQYLGPMATYRLEDVKTIRSLEAYHRVIQLQDFRVKALRKLLMQEDIFPHGYGSCTVHLRETTALWHSKKTSLIGQIETLTDVAGEMETVAYSEPIKNCATCQKACVAAVDMLRYKCRKVPRKLHRLPEDLKRI